MHKFRCFLTLALLTAWLALPAAAQFPGMGTDDDTEAAAETELVEVAAEADTAYKRFYSRFLGPESPYRPIILTVLTLVVLVQLKRHLTKVMKRQLEARVYKAENAQSFMRVWNGIWKFAIAILIIIAMTGSLKLLGLTAGFLGMMLGWSLQQPVTGIAAWLMIVVKKPFQIGDRVIIAGITGDVTDITLTHVVLNQVGGSVGGEERSGRGILIPNAILFQHIIINYTLDQEYVLNEIPVRLNFDVDWEAAKTTMLAAAREATAEVIATTGVDPQVRVEFLDWGILARLRFQCEATARERKSTEIVEVLLREFRGQYPGIRFAVPHSRIDYEMRGGGDTPLDTGN